VVRGCQVGGVSHSQLTGLVRGGREGRVERQKRMTGEPHLGAAISDRDPSERVTLTPTLLLVSFQPNRKSFFYWL
jgi:hypothetical protein